MTAQLMIDQVACPKCGGMMWDNRTTKKGNQPDYKCKTRTCDGAIWLTPKDGGKKNGSVQPTVTAATDGKKPTMREAYKQLTEWVLNDIGPVYDTYFDETVFTPDVAAACVQTLFIQACKSGKVE